MKTTWTAKKLVAILLAAVLVIAGVSSAIIFSGKSKNQDTETTQDGSNVASNTDPATEAPTEPEPTDEEMRAKGYYQVKFAMPANATDKQKDSIVLPETTWVEPGTKLNTLTSARQNGAVFLGWYYDDKLIGMIGPNDVADRDVTLYPRFDKSTVTNVVFSEDYIAHEGVKADFQVLITAHNLKEEDARKKIVVRDLTSVTDVTDYELKNVNGEKEPAREPNPNEEFYPFETESYPELKDLWDGMDEEVIEILNGFDFVNEFSGIPDLNAYYGLDEDDSPERYWREEMGLSPEQMEDLSKAVELLIQQAYAKTETYVVVPAGGAWTEGHMYQIEILDTSCLRFQNETEETGERVVYHNFTVFKEDFNNIKINSNVVFIPQSDVDGITDLSSLYTLVAGDDGEAKKNTKSGTFTYKKETLAPGTTIAIYNGKLNSDGSVNGDVGYFKIQEALGDNKYSYVGAEIEDVIWIPDVFPLPDDGNYNDRKYTMTAAQLQFSGPLYQEMNMASSVTVDVGDFVYFYSGNPATLSDMQMSGIGRIIRTEKSGNDLIVTYEPASMEDIENSIGMYMTVSQIELPTTEIDEEALKLSMEKQLLDSGFVMASAEYVTNLINDKVELPDDPDMAEALAKLTFKTDTGEEISIDKIRHLGNGAKSVALVEGPTVAIMVSGSPEHFKNSDFEFSQGLRLVFSIGFTISVALNDDSSIEIQLVAALEQEIVLGTVLSVKKEVFPFEIVVDASLRAGTFTGFGIEATIQTKGENPNKDTEWGRLLDSTGASKGDKKATQALLDLGNKLEDLSQNLDKIQNGATVSKTGKQAGQTQYTGDYEGPSASSKGGDLTTKYAEMLGNDAEYIDILKWELFRVAVSPDPLHLIEFSLEADLVVSFKLNAMVGFSISYGNAKQINYHIRVFDGEATSSKGDLETPNFRADFFVFGMAGLRAGVRLDARVGIICTKFDSIGVTVEVGFYAEFYGFLYLSYYWESGKDPVTEKMGSLLFEVGTYLEVKFLAQIGDGKLSGGVDIYSKKWPLFQLGTPEVLVPYVESDEDAIFETGLEFPEGASTMKVPDTIFGVDMMSLDSGEVNRVSKDYGVKGELNYSYEINGRWYDQFNEKFFTVSCCDLESEFGALTDRHSFRYLPATNEIVVKPAVNGQEEIWGMITFTYRGNGFGWSNVVLKRSLKIHWVGKQASAVVEYYLQDESDLSKYELVKEGSFDGYRGIEYDLIVSDDFCTQFADKGYVIKRIEFPDEDGMRAKVAEIQKEIEDLQKVNAEYQSKHNGKSSAEVIYKLQGVSYRYSQAKKVLSDYLDHNSKCLANRSGTMHFLMTDEDLVVRVYYDLIRYPIYGFILNYDGENLNETSVRDWTFTTDVVRMNEPVHEKLVAASSELPHVQGASEKVKWYYLDHSSNWAEYAAWAKTQGINYWSYWDYLDYLKEHHWDELEPLADDAVAPQTPIFVLGFLEQPQYKLTWMIDNKVIKEEMVAADASIPDVPSEFDAIEKLGYAIGDWTRSDGQEFWISQQGLFKMPYYDLVITGNWYPTFQTIHWDVEGYTWETNNIRTGELISQEWPPTWHGSGYGDNEKIGYKLTWLVIKDGKEEEFTMGTVMPAGGVTMKAVYTIGNYTVTWKDGDKVVKTEKLAYGSKVSAPDIKLGEDETVSWWTDNGYPLLDDSQVYDFDVTYIAKRHKHEWVFAGVKAKPDCKNAGLDYYNCSCGEHKLVETEPNDDHDWIGPFTEEEATCVKGRVDRYYCARCHKEKFVETDELDPNKHAGPAVFHDGVEPTCTKDGSSWYYTCGACGKQTSEPEVVKATGHRYVYETEESTCTKQGKKIGTCEKCGDVTTELLPLDDTKHEWGEVQYVWASDNSTVTAKRVCKNNSKHVEQETVDTVGVQKIAPSCDTMGTTEYTSNAFTNPLFKKQTKTVQDIPATGHAWKPATYTWTDDFSKVTAFHECANYAGHAESETVNTTMKETTIAGTLDVQRVYTATFKNGSFATQQKTVKITSDWKLVHEVAYAELVSNGIDYYKAEIHRGRDIKQNTKTGEIVTIADTTDNLITPKLRTNTISLSKLTAEQSGSGKAITATSIFNYLIGAGVPDHSNALSQVYIVLPTAPDGTGSFQTNLPFELEWAKGYSDISYDTLTQFFNTNPTGTYSVKVKIRIAYSRSRTYPEGCYDPDGEVFEGSLGDATEAGGWDLDLYGNTADFKEITAEIKITK